MFPVPVFEKSEFIRSKVQLIDFELLGSRIIKFGINKVCAEALFILNCNKAYRPPVEYLCKRLICAIYAAVLIQPISIHQ